MSAEQIEAERVEKEAEDLQKEWLRAIVNWMKLVVVWSDFMRLDTGVKKFPPSPDIMMLMYFPIALFMSKLMAENKGSRPYGWLPERVLTYIGQAHGIVRGASELCCCKADSEQKEFEAQR